MMDGYSRGKRHLVLDVDMPTEQGVVGNSHMIANSTVVCHVGTCHQVAVIAERGDTLFLGSCAVDRNTLPQGVVVTDDHFGSFTTEGEVLWLGTQYRTSVEMVVLA